MFTGIIEEIGKVERIQKDSRNCKLSIKASKILTDIHLGDSIAVNGICLTVTHFNHQSFTVDVMNETWSRTALTLLKHGSEVNLKEPYLSTVDLGVTSLQDTLMVQEKSRQ